MNIEEMPMYFGNWTDYESMVESWGKVVKTPFPTKEDVLFASYGSEWYSGDAIVVFTHGGELYEVNGGHCSCYGLSETGYFGGSESQWSPEKTSWEALSIRKLDREQHSEEATEFFRGLVSSNIAPKKLTPKQAIHKIENED